MKMNLKFDSGKVFSVLSNLRLEKINPFLLMATGALLLVLLVFMLFAGGTSQHENDDVLAQAQKSLKQVSVALQSIRRALQDQKREHAAPEPDHAP